MHLGQVVAQRHLSLAAQRVHQGLGIDIGVAVTVAANPLAHAQKTVHRLLSEFTLQVSVQARDLAQKGGFIVAQSIFHLVGHGEFCKAQQTGLPELQHAGPHLGLIGGQFTRA